MKYTEKMAHVKNEAIFREINEKIEAYRLKCAEEKKAALERDAQKKEQIRAWIAEKGTENQKKRYEIGLLPESEVIDVIRDEAYKCLDDFPRYEKMRASDVCTCEDRYEGYCNVDFSVSPSTEATAVEYDSLERISETVKQAHPDAVITMIDHVGESEDCEEEVIKKAAKVELVVGAFAFSREYAI